MENLNNDDVIGVLKDLTGWTEDRVIHWLGVSYSFEGGYNVIELIKQGDYKSIAELIALEELR